jgi:hypothetical protein
MRKIIGWGCYLVGAALTVWSLQMLINCELIGIFSRSEIPDLTFWQFMFQSSGQHLSYPNGYFVHLVRDLAVFGLGALIIVMGRDNFVFKEFSVAKNVAMISCPECRRKTYEDAYCRFCGFNLVTHQPSMEDRLPIPFWKVSLYSYFAVSVFLVVMNLLMIKA